MCQNDVCVKGGSISELFTHCSLQEEDDSISGCGEESCNETESEVSTASTECTMEPEDG